MDKPVRDVSLSGLLFRDTASTFMDPHGLPSGGDWGLQRSAAVYMTGKAQYNYMGERKRHDSERGRRNKLRGGRRNTLRGGRRNKLRREKE